MNFHLLLLVQAQLQLQRVVCSEIIVFISWSSPSHFVHNFLFPENSLVQKTTVFQWKKLNQVINFLYRCLKICIFCNAKVFVTSLNSTFSYIAYFALHNAGALFLPHIVKSLFHKCFLCKILKCKNIGRVSNKYNLLRRVSQSQRANLG